MSRAGGEGTAPGSRPRVAAATVPAFDQMTVTVRPGSDVVARMPGVLLVARSADTHEGDRSLRAVLNLLEASREGGIRAPGYRLSRALRRLIEDGAAPSDLALVAATDDGLTVVLAGAGALAVSERGWRLTCESAMVLVREVDWPPAPLLLNLGQPGCEIGEGMPDSRLARSFDLRAGVVPGSGAILASPPPPHITTPTGTVALDSDRLPAPSRDGGSLSASPFPPRRFDRIHGIGPTGRRRPALPRGVAGLESAEAVSRARVRGYRCRDGHLNDPRTLFCAICGIRMAESTGVFVEGPRPPLGLLVFDNGASFSLDENYLLGREPDVDERVRAGQLRPLVLFDTSGVISRRHAEIRLEDWDVLLVDCGSANGTLVAEREATVWSALVPGQPIRMLPSMQVRIGERSFVFESLHGAP